MTQDSFTTSPSGKEPAKRAYRRPEFLTYGILCEMTNSKSNTSATGDAGPPPLTNKTA